MFKEIAFFLFWKQKHLWVEFKHVSVINLFSSDDNAKKAEK